MDRAALGYLGKSLPLGVVECASQSDCSLDSFDHASFGVIALQTIFRVHSIKLYIRARATRCCSPPDN